MTTQPSKNHKVGNYQPSSYQATNPHSQQRLVKGPPPFRGGPTYQPLVGAPTQRLVNPEQLDKLCELRIRLNDGVAYCRAHAGDLHRQHYERGVKRAVRLLASEYMPLIRQLRKAVSDDELRAHVANLEARMEKGWGMEASEKRDDLFARLLVEYEVVMDALDDGTQSREMQRIEPVVA